MLDATVKFPFGLLYGNSYQLGNFDECIDVTVPDLSTNSTDSEAFQGQYCLAEISINITTPSTLNLTNDESIHSLIHTVSYGLIFLCMLGCLYFKTNVLEEIHT